MDHLSFLRLRLSHEKVRLGNSKTSQEMEFYLVRVMQSEKEIAGELAFLGIKEDPLPEMSDDEILAELNS